MVNAAILLSAWSAAASDIYISSRFLFFLARRGHAPTFLAHLFRYPRVRNVRSHASDSESDRTEDSDGEGGSDTDSDGGMFCFSPVNYGPLIPRRDLRRGCRAARA